MPMSDQHDRFVPLEEMAVQHSLVVWVSLLMAIIICSASLPAWAQHGIQAVFTYRLTATIKTLAP